MSMMSINIAILVTTRASLSARDDMVHGPSLAKGSDLCHATPRTRAGPFPATRRSSHYPVAPDAGIAHYRHCALMTLITARFRVEFRATADIGHARSMLGHYGPLEAGAQ